MKKKDPNKTETAFNREVKVLIEDFQSTFRVFGEGLSIVRGDLSNLTKKVDVMWEAMGRQEENIFILLSYYYRTPYFSYLAK